MNEKNIVYIPDEFVPNLSLSEEEQKREWEEYRKRVKEAFKKLNSLDCKENDYEK